MSFRSRPVLDRRHRPRWQDELRTQQLTIVAFALAIALAIGIFGAAAWNGYWSSHFRPVAAVAGTAYDRGDLDERRRIIVAESTAELIELQGQLGGPRDQLLQSQIDQISLELQDADALATSSLVDGAVLGTQADAFGVTVDREDVDAEVARRHTLPELVRARIITVDALPDDAEPDDEPTDAERDAARTEAAAARERIEDGEDFASVAADVSDDFTATSGGDMGWFGADDVAYGEYADDLAGAEAGDLVGPVETDLGFAVLELLARRERTTEGPLRDLLQAQAVDADAYRDFVRDELLVESFRTHFEEEVVGEGAPQRRVAQIVIEAPTGPIVRQERARHVLVQPLEGEDDQAAATDEEWEAARAEAEAVREQLAAEDADWYEIAAEVSDDTGSGARGGDLGWYDPSNTGFVEAFTDALADLEVGELSEPVRSEFGWHVIEKTAERASPQQQAEELVDELRDDPDAFGETAALISEDPGTAAEDGELGWVARYQVDETRETAIFGLTEVGEISDPVDAGTEGITIYQLLESSDGRALDDEQLAAIRATGFDRWLEQEVRAPVETWVDPDFASEAAQT